MAKTIIATLNAANPGVQADLVTLDENLTYKVYNDTDGYTVAEQFGKHGTAGVTVSAGVVTITGVDDVGGTATSFKISSVDEATNESALSDAFSGDVAYEPWNDANSLLALLSNASLPIDVSQAEDGTGGVITEARSGTIAPSNSLGWNTFDKANINNIDFTAILGPFTGENTTIFYFEITEDVISGVNQTYWDGSATLTSGQAKTADNKLTIYYPINVITHTILLGETGTSVGDKLLITLTRDSSDNCYVSVNQAAPSLITTDNGNIAYRSFGVNQANLNAPGSMKMGRAFASAIQLTELTTPKLSDVQSWVLAGDLT